MWLAFLAGCRMYILIRNKVLQLSVHFLLGYFNKLELRVGKKKNVNIVLCASHTRRRDSTCKHNLNNSIFLRWETVACRFRDRQTLMPRRPNNGFHFSGNNYYRLEMKQQRSSDFLFSNYGNWQEQNCLITVGNLLLCLIEVTRFTLLHILLKTEAVYALAWPLPMVLRTASSLFSINDGQGQLEGQSRFQMISHFFTLPRSLRSLFPSPFLSFFSQSCCHSHLFPMAYSARLGIWAGQHPEAPQPQSRNSAGSFWNQGSNDATA